jgi:integrase
LFPRTWTRADGTTGEVWLIKFQAKRPTGETIRVRQRAKGEKLREAERERDALRAAIVTGTYGVRDGVPTLREVVKEFYGSPAFTHRKPSTQRNYRDLIDRVILPELGPRSATELEGSPLDAFYRRLDKTGRSVETQRGTLRVLRRLLNWAQKRGILPKVPEIEMPEDHEAKPQAQKRRYLTPVEADKLIAAAEGDDHALVVVGLRCGPRAGEFLGLEWTDVEFGPPGKLWIRRSVDEGETLTTKSGEERSVPLSDQAREALLAQRKRHPKSVKVFPKVETRHQIAVVVRRVARAAGVTLPRAAGERSPGPHALRHAMGAAAAASGIPVRVLQAWMGHADISTTEGYFQLPPGAGDSLISLLDRAGQGGSAAGSSSAPTPTR